MVVKTYKMLPPQNTPTALIALLNQLKPISVELQDAISEKFLPVQVKKNRMLVTEGSVCNYMWFLVDGLVCSWVNLPGEDDDETITRLMTPGYVVVSPLSFYSNAPSVENIEVLKDASFFRIHKTDLDDMYKDFPEFNYHTRILTEQYACTITRRELLLRHQDVEERFKYFIKNYGHLLQFINERYAASFANMNRATFNKLKNGTYRKPISKNKIGGGGKIYRIFLKKAVAQITI